MTDKLSEVDIPDELVEELREEQRWGNVLAGKAADRIYELELELHFRNIQSQEHACYACIEKSESDAARIEKLTAAVREYVSRTEYGDANNIQRRMDRAVLLKIVEKKND